VLFEIIMRRYETRSTLMTSNRPLDDWGKLIGDVPSATAIDNDRLPPPVFLQASDDRLHSIVIDPRIPLIRLDPLDGPHLDLHGALLLRHNRSGRGT
jgi:hypothetical protein